MRRSTRLTFSGLALCAAVFSGSAASAHAHLLQSNPAANSTVAAPKAIVLTFSEKLAPAFSKFELGMADGMKMNVKTSVSKDGKTITGAPAGKLMSGTYKITWHAASAGDGHKMDGALTFTVK